MDLNGDQMEKFLTEKFICLCVLSNRSEIMEFLVHLKSCDDWKIMKYKLFLDEKNTRNKCLYALFIKRSKIVHNFQIFSFSQFISTISTNASWKIEFEQMSVSVATSAMLKMSTMFDFACRNVDVCVVTKNSSWFSKRARLVNSSAYTQQFRSQIAIHTARRQNAIET